jgi:hypothetical protein
LMSPRISADVGARPVSKNPNSTRAVVTVS